MQVVEERVSSKPVNDTNDILSQRRTSLTPSGLGKKELIQAWREKASDEAKLLDSLSPTSVKSDKKDDGTPDTIEVSRNEESPSSREHDIYKLGEITRENSSSYEIESEMSASSYASVSESEDHEQKSLIRRKSSKSASNSRKSSANDVNKPVKPIGVGGRRSNTQSVPKQQQPQPPPPRYSMSDIDDRHDIEIIKEQLNPLRRSSENRKFSASNSGGSNTFIYNKKSPERERTDSKPPVKKQSILIGDYQLGEVLGRGATGVVYQGLNVKTGDFVAIKQVAKRLADEDIIKRELNILRSIQHPNIIKVIDCVETTEKFNLIFEYIENGSLTDILHNFGAFPEALVAFYTQQLLQGLAHVHDKGLIHRDIKASNVLVGKDGVIKLSDFGVASTDDNTENKNLYGSPYWMAPEVIENNTYFKTSDIWSVGCTVIELLTCNPPYFDISPPNAMFKIVSDIHPPLPDPISDELKDFLLKCFERDPSKRSTAKDLINHPWICSGNTKSQRSSKAVPLRSFDDLRTVLIEYNQNNKQRIQTLRGTFKYPAEENINIDELLQYNDDSASELQLGALSPSQSLASLSKENNTVVLKEGILKSKHKYWCCIQENFPALAYYKKKEHYIKGKSPKGQILLLGCTVKKSNIVKKEPFGFVIQQRDNRRYFLAADTEEEQISWVDTIIKVEAGANAATSANEKIRKQDEIIKKLQNALQTLIDEKEGKNFNNNNLKRPNEAFYKEYNIF